MGSLLHSGCAWQRFFRALRPAGAVAGLLIFLAACRPTAERAQERLASHFWPTLEAFGSASAETAAAIAQMAESAPDDALFQAALEARDFFLAEALFSRWSDRHPDWFDPESYAAGVALMQHNTGGEALSRAMEDPRFRRLHLTQRAWLEGRLAVLTGKTTHARLALELLRELAPREPSTAELSALIGLGSDDPVERWRAEQRLVRLSTEDHWLATIASDRLARTQAELSPAEHRRLRDDLLAAHASGEALRWAFWWHHAQTSDELPPAVPVRLQPATPKEVLTFGQRLVDEGSIAWALRFVEAFPAPGAPGWEQTRARLRIFAALIAKDPRRAREAWESSPQLPPADRAIWDAFVRFEADPGETFPEIAPAAWNPVEAGSLELRLYLDLALRLAPQLSGARIDRLLEVATLLEERGELRLDPFTRLQGPLLSRQRDAAMLELATRLLRRFPGDPTLANNALYLHLLRHPGEPPPQAWIDALPPLEEGPPVMRSTRALLLLRQGELDAASQLINQAPPDASPSSVLVRLAIEAERDNAAGVRQLLARLDPDKLILSERRLLDQLRAAYP